MTPSNPNFSGDSNTPRRVEQQYGENTPPSIAIVQAVAIIEDIDPMDFSPKLGLRLYDFIDPNALDELVDTSEEETVTIMLTLRNNPQYDVTVRDTGKLVVTKQAEA